MCPYHFSKKWFFCSAYMNNSRISYWTFHTDYLVCWTTFVRYLRYFYIEWWCNCLGRNVGANCKILKTKIRISSGTYHVTESDRMNQFMNDGSPVHAPKLVEVDTLDSSRSSYTCRTASSFDWVNSNVILFENTFAKTNASSILNVIHC